MTQDREMIRVFDEFGVRMELIGDMFVAVPVVAPADEEKNARMAEKEERRKKFREVVKRHLSAMAQDLNDFEQTTHGHWSLTPEGIVDVAECLTKAWNEPRAYTISDLSQAIDQFIKEPQI